MRHPQGKYLDFAEIDGRHLFDGKRNEIGGINAGLMLLETSSKDFRRMEVQKIPLAAPEQDYLARYHVEGWYCLSIQTELPATPARISQQGRCF